MGQLSWPDFVIPFEPLNEGLAQTPPDPYERSDFEQGMPRQRRIFRNAPTTFDLQWAFTPEQFRVWKGFRNAVGAGTFLIPVFSDLEYVTVSAQFVKGSIKQVRSGGEWMVSAQIETMDNLNPSLTDFVISLLLYGYDGTIDDFLGELHHALHVVYPANIP